MEMAGVGETFGKGRFYVRGPGSATNVRPTSGGAAGAARVRLGDHPTPLPERRMTRLAVALLTVLAVAPAADAHPHNRHYNTVGFGVGIGVRFGGGPGVGPVVYPAFGFVGPTIGSFWSNGNTLSGPPVPTFEPIGGVFGGGDQRRTSAPARSWASTRTPTPATPPTRRRRSVTG